MTNSGYKSKLEEIVVLNKLCFILSSLSTLRFSQNTSCKTANREHLIWESLSEPFHQHSITHICIYKKNTHILVWHINHRKTCPIK